ncbi:right-handed parallel beta-helix repeat-containing protein [Microvirga sp. SRT01]|uniref:Right-handed parallel beta-helix repeat-containing protein n=1 Tax=Sphingomonas longa TaxID=2778730 RepID=A0ABS2D3G2_9SPHN|nr:MULTISPECIES: right-handed parallel beta-helix repeat-containing protein [Alphaproteobacteria]MBM6575455.1 right-handed parallel beta-helix repeat-containing protein [Sphingomonas sp. BT552]MBR7708503.1 right-handed parallel beta-helix repeat-containing protein [Microvirga sp. SRT01]
MAVSATSAFSKFDAGFSTDDLTTGASYIVKDTAGLLNILKAAKSGDTVYLQPGVYASVNLNNIQINGNVTIASLNANKPAVFADLKINNSKGLTLSGVELDASVKKADMGYQVLNSSNITLDKLYVHGTLNDNAADDVRALLVRNSTNVTVTNSKFEQLSDALSHIDSNRVTFSGNSFTGIRDNGIAGGGTSNLTIKDNYFTNFDHTGDIHPDAIQVWTTNTKTTTTDVTITGNVFDRGTGDIVQGIFMRDPYGTLPFERVTISGNTVIGAAYNGIYIDGGKDVTISDNTVVAVDGQPSWIGVLATTNARVTNNVASDYVYNNSQVTKVGNVIMNTATAAAAASVTAWLKTNANLPNLANRLDDVIFDRVGLRGYVDVPGTNGRANLIFTETVMNGTAGADRMTAGAIGDYRLTGGAGNDTFTGNAAGKTTMIGGTGDDTYVVKTVNDVVVESANGGTDTVVTSIDYTMGSNVENVRLAASGLTVHGNELANTMSGSDGDNVLYGEGGNDILMGGGGHDELHGGLGNDTLRGDAGDDILWGDDGNDLLYGGAGNDILRGGTGSNTYEGGAGSDTIYAGNGQETFVYRSADFAAGVNQSVDHIFNFSSAQRDKIHLGAVDANTRTTADDAFKFIGTSEFHRVAGELRYEVVGRDSYILGDTNGDGVADVKIHVVGVTSLSAGDFVL